MGSEFVSKPQMPSDSGRSWWKYPPLEDGLPAVRQKPLSNLPPDSALPEKPFAELERWQMFKQGQPSPTKPTVDNSPSPKGFIHGALAAILQSASTLFGAALGVLSMGPGPSIVGAKEKRGLDYDYPRLRLNEDEYNSIQQQIANSPGDTALLDMAVRTGDRSLADITLANHRASRRATASGAPRALIERRATARVRTPTR